MPTRSDEQQQSRGGGPNDWAASCAKPARSVFRNYWPKADESETGSSGGAPHSLPTLPERGNPGGQAAIHHAIARCFLYRFLAKAYEDPTPEGWRWLSAEEQRQSLLAAVQTDAAPVVAETARRFEAQLKPDSFESFFSAYLAAFGHAARGRCPLNEIEYGDLKADPLFQPHRLADLAAFYRAFGLEVAEEAGERHDHICLELEFMSVLAAKEAYALEHQLSEEDLCMCRRAQERFLRDHLGRWTPAFTRRLGRMAGESPLGALARVTGAFIQAECSRFGIVPGSEDLILRPADERAESICAGSCGIAEK